MATSMIGRIALITGGGGDIGRTVAVHLAAAGAQVIISDLESAKDGLDLTTELCQQANPDAQVHQFPFDVTDTQRVISSINTISSVIGTPDAIFNNAGYQGQFAPISDCDPQDFKRVMDINVVGVFNLVQQCSRALIRAGIGGAIVNTASMAGVGGGPNMAAYSASKSAVIGLTKVAAKDLAPAGIRVNAVSPGFIGTGAMWDRQVKLQAETPSQYYADDIETVEQQMLTQIPMRRGGTLDEVATAVLFLLSDASSYMTGSNLELAGGAS